MLESKLAVISVIFIGITFIVITFIFITLVYTTFYMGNTYQGLIMKTTYLIIFYSLVSLTLLIPNIAYAGKKHCQPYRDKLTNIQSQQRQGYSLKQGQSLKKREQAARDKWWQCEKGLLKPSSKSSKSSKTKAKQKKLALAKKKAQKKSAQKKKQLNQQKSNGTPAELAPFASTKSIIAKQKYQGKELQQWLSFYQAPKGCTRPKNMKKFTACIEDKHQQQLVFDRKLAKRQQYAESK